VYGPHVALSLLQFISAAPPGYAIRGYPDICHTLKSQFEVRTSSFLPFSRFDTQAGVNVSQRLFELCCLLPLLFPKSICVVLSMC
jgi:hypothetical protein